MAGGVRDLLARRTTVGSCLARIALPKLQECGLVAHDFSPGFAEGELTLYRLVRQEGGDAYSRYNALLRQLSSFERSLPARMRQASGGEARK